MRDRTSKMNDTVNVTMHSLEHFYKEVSYAKVQRNTAYIGNIIDKVLEQNKMLDRETLLFTAGLLRNGIIELLKAGKSVDLLEMGTLYLKPAKGMDTLSPSIGDVPPMKLAFTPSEFAQQAVKSVVVAGDITKPNAPSINELYNLSALTDESVVSKGHSVRLKGNKIRVAGDEAEVGLFFAPCDEDGNYKNDVASWVQISASELIDNTASTLLFNVPSGIESGKYRLIVRTAYGSGSRVNKTVRNGVFAEIVSVE